MTSDIRQIKCHVELRTDYYFIVTTVVEDIPFCGILFKSTEKFVKLFSFMATYIYVCICNLLSSALAPPFGFSVEKSAESEAPLCSELKRLVDADLQSDSHSGAKNGLMRVNQQHLSSLCFRQSLSSAPLVSPYSALQNQRVARGIRSSTDFRSSIRLRCGIY